MRVRANTQRHRQVLRLPTYVEGMGTEGWPEDNGCLVRLELLGLIEDYRQGLVPLIVPLT